MTSRERVHQTICHKEPDRVPKGELAIEAKFSNRILGTDYPLDYQHYERDLKIRTLFNMDYVNMGDWPNEFLFTDEKGNRHFRSNYGYEFMSSGMSRHLTKPPIDDIRNAKKYKVPDLSKVTGDMVKQFKENTQMFVFGQIGGPVSTLDEMFAMEDYMVYCLTNTAQMGILGEKVMEYEVEKAKILLKQGADGIIIGDDIAFNSGVFLPPRIMKEIVYPFYEMAIKEIKAFADVPVFLHSDGDLRLVLKEIVRCGFNGLHSLQPSAGMDIRQIKKEYGKDLCLVGNIDLDYVMTFASPKEVEEVVKETIDVAAEGGGYILSTCNALVDAIPRENAEIMYKTAETYGIY